MSDQGEIETLRRLLGAVLVVASELDLTTVLRRIVEAAVELVGARYGALGVLDETHTRLARFITVGLDDDTRQAIGRLPEGHGILGLLVVDPRPLRLADLTAHPDSHGFPAHHPPMRSFLGTPISVRGSVFGNLYLTDKRDAEEFTPLDQELVVGLGGVAAMAIENARLHVRIQELALLEDRERIARDLHDTVIQRLFATGMALQGAARAAGDPALAARIEASVEDLDLTVKHIRSAIFGLETTRPTGQGLRDRVLALCREAAGALGFDPHPTFRGTVDSSVGPESAVELLTTLREALSNVARHAEASRVDVAVSVNGELVLRVADDGCGPPDGPVPGGHGLRNMAQRAERLGGRLAVRANQPSGTILEWRVPRPI